MVSVQYRPRNRWRLHQVLGHMSWTKIWTAGFGTKLSLYVNTWLRVSISEPKTLTMLAHRVALKRATVDDDRSSGSDRTFFEKDAL